MVLTVGSRIEFKTLCNVLEEIAKARGLNKVEILQRFITKCRNISHGIKKEDPQADVSLFPVLRLILPDLERERGPHNLKEKSLATLYVRIFCLGKGSQEASKLVNYRTPVPGESHGCDFADRAYWVLRRRLLQGGSAFTIERINSFLDDISKRNESARRRDFIFKELLQQMNPLELKWITRIVIKNLRLGLSTKRILQAYHPDANDLYNVASDLRQICDKLHNAKARYEHNVKVFSHFKPMLLEMCSIEEAAKLFNDNDAYFVQAKYDGERSQMHMKDGVFKYYTRQGFDITGNSSYGETKSSGGFLTNKIASLLDANCHSIILDGELMGWHKRDKVFGSKGMDFDVKKLSSNSSFQPCFVAFDIIMYNDNLLINKAYHERLKYLERAFGEEEGALVRSKTTTVADCGELLSIFNQCIKDGDEGVVLKKSDGVYKPNVRERSGCYKIKPEYSESLVQDVDLIILGGYYGDGKYTGLIKSFMIGVAAPPDVEGGMPSQFLCVASASNGLTYKQLVQLKERFEEHWIKKCPIDVIGPKSDPPDLWIRPENSLILTIRATEMTSTTAYPTGYSLRFPRVEQIREDKPWYSACTMTELLSLVKDRATVQKLTKRLATTDDMENPPVSKRSKPMKTILPKIESKHGIARPTSARRVYLTRLLDQKEICVVNGDDQSSKERIERVLRQHRAKIVQTQRDETYCVIVGNARTARAKDVIQSRKYDVVTTDWFRRVTKEENWPSLKEFLPWELLSCRESTKRRLDERFDEYYDSFTVDADEESLKRCLEKAEEAIEESDSDVDRMMEVDRELFEDGVSPYSVFRNVVGFFDCPNDYNATSMFRFMAGRVSDTLDDSVTHVFVEGAPSPSVTRYASDNATKQRRSKIMKVEWIEDCFRKQRSLPISAYLV